MRLLGVLSVNMYFSCNGTFACRVGQKHGTCLVVGNACIVGGKGVPYIIVLFSSLSRVRLIAYFKCRHILNILCTS